jgi:hypothetical protein
MDRWVRNVLASFSGVITVSAIGGGAALILGSLTPGASAAIVPPAAFLRDSPFPSYVVPGVILAVVVGGTQAVACGALLRGARSAGLITAIAAYALLIWIFVQMVFIPFSVLQAVYFAAAAAELGFLLLGLGLLKGDQRRL